VIGLQAEILESKYPVNSPSYFHSGRIQRLYDVISNVILAGKAIFDMGNIELNLL